MDIQIRKLKLIEWIAREKNETIIVGLEKFRRFSHTKTKEKISPMTIEEFYAMIDEAEQDSKNGRVIEQNELVKQSENW
jgi:hypothetical protein